MTSPETPIKRAITLAGGGPTAGIHLGILKYLKEQQIKFDVWALSCIGAWVGIVYNQCEKGREVEQTKKFFKEYVFRDDVGYSRFPINTVFGPDWWGNSLALRKHLLDAETYKHLILPDLYARAITSVEKFWSLWADPEKRTSGDFNSWMLNHALAIDPLTRFLTSMMFLSPINGLGRIYYPDSSFLKSIDFKNKLRGRDKPFIYHNAWNLSQRQLELFANKDVPGHYAEISAATLCACSALPFIEPTVEMNGDIYCEGALVDTVNFRNLIEDHPDVDEIWVSRIVDQEQVQPPRNLTDGLGNLCQLFAATVGEDDIKLFMYHVKDKKDWSGTVVEMRVPNRFPGDDGKSVQLNFDWSHANLENCMNAGYRAARAAHALYKEMGHPKEFGNNRPAPGVIRHVQAQEEFGRVPTLKGKRASRVDGELRAAQAKATGAEHHSRAMTHG